MLVHWFLKYQCSLLPSLVWPLLIYLDSWTIQVPMQYCSLQHQTLLPSTITSKTGHCFCFDSISSLFFEVFLHSSPGAYWVRTDLGSLSFSVISFCLFILFMEILRQEYWSDLPFPSPVDHVLSELSMTCPSWVALHNVAHIFTELDKGVELDKASASVLPINIRVNFP